MSDCPAFRPDHNGECLNCDEWADAHTFDALVAGYLLSKDQQVERPHTKVATDCWNMICALHLPPVVVAQNRDPEAFAAAIRLIEIACDSAAEHVTRMREELKKS